MFGSDKRRRKKLELYKLQNHSEVIAHELEQFMFDDEFKNLPHERQVLIRKAVEYIEKLLVQTGA